MRFFVLAWVCVWLWVALGAAQSGQSNSTAVTGTQQQGQREGDPNSKQLPQTPPTTVGDPPAQPRSATADNIKDQGQKTQEQTTGTSNDRLFWTLPNFLTVNSVHVPPLTTGQKFKVVARGTFDPVEYPYIAFLAAISQAADSEPGYGQGAVGYGKRYGAAFADNGIENFMTGAILPSLLKQDPRFYQSGKGSFGRRLGYAISRIAITRSDSGHTQFNISEVGGSAVSAGISTYSYHPKDDRTVGNAISVWGTQVGWDTVTIVVKEFWPDIRRKLSRTHDTVGAMTPPTSGPAGQTVGK